MTLPYADTRMVMSAGAHAAALLRLAGPLAVAQLSFIAMNVTDTVLLGALGGDALAAGGFAAALAWTVDVMLHSTLQAVGTFISRARGAGQSARDEIVTGFVLALLLLVPSFVWQSFAADVLRLLGEPGAVVDDAERFLHVLRWDGVGSIVGIGFMRALFPALGHTRPMLFVPACAAIANGFLSYGLIHGTGPLPALGYLGSALGTVITLWAMLAVLAVLALRPAVRRNWQGGRFDPRTARALLRIGVPIGATVGVEATVFTTGGLLMGLLGPDALAAHQVTLSVAATCFMVPLGLAQAANVRVAFFIGAGQGADARRAGLVAVGMALLFGVGTAVLLASFPHAIAVLYLRDGPAVPVTVSLLAIAAVFQVVDGTQTVAAGALRGLADTRVPFIIASVGYWAVGFAVSVGLGFGAGWGPQGVWWGFAAGLLAVAVLMTARFHRLTRPFRSASAPRP